MSNLVFVGSREIGFFSEQVASRYNLEVEYIPSNGHITQQINEILYISQVQCIVYDIQQYIDDPEIICEEILKIQNCNGATPIIYAPGFSTFSRVIVALYEGGISEFILASDLSEQRSQLEKSMNGYYSKNGIAELEVIKTLSEQEAQLKDELKYTTIGVVGTANRIGTTTQALHITKYLIAKGYTACYVHINNTDYIKDLQEWWGAEIQDDFIGKVVYEGIDHFYKTEHLTEIKKLGYDFYVYDYGSFTNHFNRESFLERDIKIYVLGWKPSEMQATFKLLQSKIHTDGKYILSFGDELPEEDIEGIMGERKNSTIVPTRCTEPYKLYDVNTYDPIFQLDARIEEEPKRKGFFKLFGGKNK